jgi:tRNA nucleotidyltransferase/poly(A) polymerase
MVGGGVRDSLLGRLADEWDLTTDARPERMLELFPAGRYENRFGTVTIGGVEVTTYRRDHQYGDHRRPDSVTFSDDIEEDLSRRDFTVNAIAWGRAAGETALHWQDPTNGLADLEARVLRAVGEPHRRFDEDSLRLVRAARLAGQLGFSIEPQTMAAMRRAAPLVQHVSRERLGNELRKMLKASQPSAGLRLLADTGLLAYAFPLLEAQRGVSQDKRPGDDLWAHSLASLDAAASSPQTSDRLRLAALLHDVGKPSTFADGHFVGHDIEGARLADELLSSLAFGRREIEPVTRLIAQHMFQYLPDWSDAAVRRFIRRVGADLVLDLLRLRQADNVGSGLPADAGRLAELRARVTDVLDRHEPLGVRDLAVDGRVLTGELGLAPGPVVGRLLDHLVDFVIAEPARNSRQQLLDEARAELLR